MVPSFRKGHLLAKKGGKVFATRPKVKVILWGFFWFWPLIEDEEGLFCPVS
jgi:hypothetical protein